MPGSAVGVQAWVGGLGKCLVSSFALDECGAVVDRRPDQWVTEPHGRAEGDQIAGFCGRRRRDPETEAFPGAPKQGGVASRVSGGGRSSICVGAGRLRTWRTNLASSARGSGSGSGREVSPASCSGVSSRPSSMRASGLPLVSETMRWLMWSAR